MNGTCDDKYITLLRGINIGGRNIIKIDDIKRTFEKMRFKDVKTYIYSGNIIFKSEETNKAALTNSIEKILSKEYNYDSRILIFNFNEFDRIVKAAPGDFGTKREQYRYEIWFLREPLTAVEVLKSIRLKESFDNIHDGNNVVYSSRLISEAEKNKLARIIRLPVYQNITVRNWSTATKMYKIMKDMGHRFADKNPPAAPLHDYH
jgi:uncharacterized protein (DUF1697 family)